MTIKTRRFDINLLWARDADMSESLLRYLWRRLCSPLWWRVGRSEAWPCWQLRIVTVYIRYWYDDVRWSAVDQQLVAVDPKKGIRWPR